MRTLLSAALAALVTLSANTQAAPILDFGMVAPTDGTISWTGGVTPLLGSGITVDNLMASDTLVDAGVLHTCLNCTLSFQTGNYLGSTSNAWEFAGGGQLTLSGQLDLNGDLVADGPVINLLSAVFDNTSVFNIGFGTFKLQILGAAFSGQLAPELATYYLVEAAILGGINLSFTTNASPGQAFTSSALHSGDVITELTAVPLPPSVWLFGAGALGLVAVARRRSPDVHSH